MKNEEIAVLVLLGLGVMLVWARRPQAQAGGVLTAGSPTVFQGQTTGGVSGNATNPLTGILGGVSDILTRVFSRTTSAGNQGPTVASSGPIGAAAPVVGYYPAESPPRLPALPPAPDFYLPSPDEWESWQSLDAISNIQGMDLSAFAAPSFVASQGVTVPPPPPGSRIIVTGLE